MRPATIIDVHAHPAEARIAVARPRLPSAGAILPYLEQMDEARWYSNFGPLLTAFEERLAARFSGDAHITTMVNATQGLTLTLRAMGLARGDLCALPAWTFVATAHAVAEAGLVPWFVDVDPETWMLDPAALTTVLEQAPGRLAAVAPVSAFGLMPNLDAWKAFRDQTGLPVVVDAAAAFDAAVDCELPLVVSLHATKVLGLGEGGFLATQDAALATRVRQLTTYGFQGSRDAQFPATNAKLSEYAAAVGLAALDAWPADRLRFALTAQRLRIALAMNDQVRFQPGWGIDWMTSVCVVSVPEGSAAFLERALAEDGVDTRRWWGSGCQDSAAFIDCPYTDLSATRRLATSTLGLPFAIDLSPDEIDRIAASLTRALDAWASQT